MHYVIAVVRCGCFTSCLLTSNCKVPPSRLSMCCQLGKIRVLQWSVSWSMFLQSHLKLLHVNLMKQFSISMIFSSPIFVCNWKLITLRYDELRAAAEGKAKDTWIIDGPCPPSQRTDVSPAEKPRKNRPCATLLLMDSLPSQPLHYNILRQLKDWNTDNQPNSV